MAKETKPSDLLNVGDKVQYNNQNAMIVDHYGAGIYAIELNGNWLSVNESELISELNEDINEK